LTPFPLKDTDVRTSEYPVQLSEWAKLLLAEKFGSGQMGCAIHMETDSRAGVLLSIEHLSLYQPV